MGWCRRSPDGWLPSRANESYDSAQERGVVSPDIAFPSLMLGAVGAPSTRSRAYHSQQGAIWTTSSHQSIGLRCIV